MSSLAGIRIVPGMDGPCMRVYGRNPNREGIIADV